MFDDHQPMSPAALFRFPQRVDQQPFFHAGMRAVTHVPISLFTLDRQRLGCRIEGARFASLQDVRYFAFIPSALKQRGEVTPPVHHSDDLDGMNRAVIGVGPYLIEDHIGRFDQLRAVRNTSG